MGDVKRRRTPPVRDRGGGRSATGGAGVRSVLRVRRRLPEHERPPESTSTQLFVVLKGRRRGEPLSAAGLDEILDGARGRAGLAQSGWHQLRHTCFTRLREAGMALEATQTLAGHASIDSTRI